MVSTMLAHSPVVGGCLRLGLRRKFHTTQLARWQSTMVKQNRDTQTGSSKSSESNGLDEGSQASYSKESIKQLAKGVSDAGIELSRDVVSPEHTLLQVGSANTPLMIAAPNTVDAGGTPYIVKRPSNQHPYYWKRIHVREFLMANQGEYGLDLHAIESIYRNGVNGYVMLQLTREVLCGGAYHLTDSMARAIVSLIKALKKPQPVEPKLDHPRQQRWNKLNAILANNKNQKRRPLPGQEDTVTGYTYTSWSDVGPIFNSIGRRFHEKVKLIPHADYEALSRVLSWVIKCQLCCDRPQQAKRIHLIAPVLWSVAQLLPDVRVSVGEQLNGKRITAHSHYEFILTRGSKRVCIVEAKRGNLEQGMARSLVGCEVAADLDDSHEVFGIVTDFTEWIFLKSLDDEILWDGYNNIIPFDDIHGIPSKEGLMRVAGKLRAFLE